ncbi:MAG TPA: DNA polymerase III subunit gamma/tau, partial [Dehalococcoidales bacterium]|nr:DNA polymerase III subunit gamma/tau [Dehalococcoidales bacterium]
GTGKTSTARILAKAVNCLTNGKGEPCNTCEMCRAIAELRALDVIEIDAASNTGVEDIRSLREKVNYSPNNARYKVYIIDEVHMLSNSAANALLKTLEEPPPHVIFILATTEVHKLLPTILSRCQRYDFRRLSQANVATELTRVCQGEGIKLDAEAMRLIARSSTGSMRDALNLLEQLTTYYGSEPSLSQAQTMLGITGDYRTKEMVKQIIKKDISAGVATINSVNNDGLDLKQFSRELVDYLRSLLLIKTGSNDALDLLSDEIAEFNALAAEVSLEQILRAVKLFGQLQTGFDSYPTLPLELALVDSALAPEPEEMPAEKQSVPSRQPQKIVPLPPTVRPQPRKETLSVAAAPPPPRIAPRPAQPEPARASALALQGGTEIERLKLNWRMVIEQAPLETKKANAIAILRSGAHPAAIENDTVILAFRHSIHKELMEKLENQQVAEKIISNFLGHSCRISCIIEDNPLLKAALKMGAQRIDTEER